MNVTSGRTFRPIKISHIRALDLRDYRHGAPVVHLRDPLPARVS